MSADPESENFHVGKTKTVAAFAWTFPWRHFAFKKFPILNYICLPFPACYESCCTSQDIWQTDSGGLGAAGHGADHWSDFKSDAARSGGPPGLGIAWAGQWLEQGTVPRAGEQDPTQRLHGKQSDTRLWWLTFGKSCKYHHARPVQGGIQSTCLFPVLDSQRPIESGILFSWTRDIPSPTCRCQGLNPGHSACSSSALLLSYCLTPKWGHSSCGQWCSLGSEGCGKRMTKVVGVKKGITLHSDPWNLGTDIAGQCDPLWSSDLPPLSSLLQLDTAEKFERLGTLAQGLPSSSFDSISADLAIQLAKNAAFLSALRQGSEHLRKAFVSKVNGLKGTGTTFVNVLGFFGSVLA